MKHKTMVIILSALILGACAMRPSTEEIQAIKPDCAKAEEQIAMLDEEMIRTHDRVLAGIGTIVPSAAVVSLLAGEWSNNKDVAIGTYEEVLNNKIEEIKRTCLNPYVGPLREHYNN